MRAFLLCATWWYVVNADRLVELALKANDSWRVTVRQYSYVWQVVSNTGGAVGIVTFNSTVAATPCFECHLTSPPDWVHWRRTAQDGSNDTLIAFAGRMLRRFGRVSVTTNPIYMTVKPSSVMATVAGTVATMCPDMNTSTPILGHAYNITAGFPRMTPPQKCVFVLRRADQMVQVALPNPDGAYRRPPDLSGVTVAVALLLTTLLLLAMFRWWQEVP